MASVVYSLAKAMFKSGANSNVEIPNFQFPQIKYIFELPFEFRIAVAFVGTWIGAIAFDHITDILEKKYLWFIGLLILGSIVWALKQYAGIGPSSEDVIALFDEDREGFKEVLSKQWRPIISNQTLVNAIGKPVAIQWVSKQYGELYLTDEKKPYFTFAKKIEHASKFQLIGIPSGDDGIDTVAFYSETRRAYITNTILGYWKVEAQKVDTWERFQLDFVQPGQDIFQLRSVSRGRHVMHIRENNYHKGFHDKYGEVAYFKMFYFDSNASDTKNSPVSSVVNSVTNSDSEFTSSPSILSRDVSVSNIPELSKKLGIDSGWKIISREEKIRYSCPVVMHVESEGFIIANPSGDILFTDRIDEATHFQICGIPNDSAMAFFSRKHQRYLSLGGLFINKLVVSGTRFDAWEKFKLYFDRDNPHRCKVKVLKTWPPPTIMRSHLGLEKDKNKAIFTFLYNESKSI